MADFLIFVAGLLSGLCCLLSYRLGKRDAEEEKTPQKPILPPIRKAKPKVNQEEKAALEKERRIDEFKG